MKTLLPVNDQTGNLSGYMFECLGCGNMHWYNLYGGVGFSLTHPKWNFNGDLENPSFTPSLLNTKPNSVCHLYITNGKIEYLSDCTHSLAGQTVTMIDLET